jgi:hypothetical protein
MGELFTAPHLLVLSIAFMFPAVLVVIPFWQIFKKAGMAGPLALLMMVPLVNLAMLYLLAFSKWNVAPDAYPLQAPGSGSVMP